MENYSTRTKKQARTPLEQNGVVWQDVTTYRRNDADDTPAQSFSTHIGICTITVTKGHIDYRGVWVVSCQMFYMNLVELPKQGIGEEEACSIALEIVFGKFQELRGYFSKIKI